MSEVTLHDILEYGHYIQELSKKQLNGTHGNIWYEWWRYKDEDYVLIWKDDFVFHWTPYRKYKNWIDS